MSITIAGFCLLLGLTRLLLSRKLDFESLLILTLFCELYIEIGYAIQIGGYINYRTIMEVLLFLAVVTKLNNVPRQLVQQSVILYICLIIPVFLLMLFPSNQLVAVIDTSWDDILGGARRKNPIVNGFVIQMLLQFFIYIMVYIYIISKYRFNDYLRLLSKTNRLINYMLILGLFEFFFVTVLHQGSLWGELKESFFGISDSTIMENRGRGGLFELCLFTKEASHYAVLLFLTFFIKMGYNLSKRKKFVDSFLFLNLFLMAVAMSFTSVLCAFGITVILLSYRWRIIKPSSMKYEKKILFLVVSAVLLLFSSLIADLNTEGFFSRRILSIIEEVDIVTTDRWMTETSALEWSNRVRLLSVYQTLLAFIHRPIFGYGIGSVTAHGATPMFLAGAGVIGVYLWSKFNFFQKKIVDKFDSDKFGLKVAVITFFLVFMFGGFLRNFYEISAIMLAISFCIIFSKKRSI